MHLIGDSQWKSFRNIFFLGYGTFPSIFFLLPNRYCVQVLCSQAIFNKYVGWNFCVDRKLRRQWDWRKKTSQFLLSKRIFDRICHQNDDASYKVWMQSICSNFVCFIFPVMIWLPQFWNAKIALIVYWWRKRPTMIIRWYHCRKRKWTNCVYSEAIPFCWRENDARKRCASCCRTIRAQTIGFAWTVSCVTICVFDWQTLFQFNLAQMLNMAAVYTSYQSMIPLKV